MRKTVLGLIGAAALAMASTASASILISFDNPTGDLGTSYTYSNGAYSVTATGWSSANFVTNVGTPDDLFGKAGGGDENGVGLLDDPSGNNEIWYADGTPAIILNVSSLLGVTSSSLYTMGSTTNGEIFNVLGWNGSIWSLVDSGNADGTRSLPGWGTYSLYAFTSGSPAPNGNVLLGSLDVTPSVPEPATWAMMLVGFGAVGFSLRRKRRAGLIKQIA